jgi:hypothetical protein
MILPTLFKLGKYRIYFWSNEKDEPIHIHVCEGVPIENATKIWLTQNGGFVIANNDSRIPQNELNGILKMLPIHYFLICSKWKSYFGIDDIKFYC